MICTIRLDCVPENFICSTVYFERTARKCILRISLEFRVKCLRLYRQMILFTLAYDKIFSFTYSDPTKLAITKY